MAKNSTTRPGVCGSIAREIGLWGALLLGLLGTGAATGEETSGPIRTPPNVANGAEEIDLSAVIEATAPMEILLPTAAELPASNLDEPKVNTEEPSDHHLLLDNDRILTGIVTKVVGGYRLKRNGGSVFYEEGRVRCFGATKAELYQHKISQIPKHDLSERMKIHKWCLSNGLEQQAQSELEQMLVIDPTNEEIALRLRNLQAKANLPTGNLEQRPAARARPLAPQPEKVVETFVRGHGSEAFIKYNAIERMLLNRCATGACHGSARHAGNFRLFGDERMKDVRTTARNLNAVLNTIDLKQPHQSLILYKAINAHGQAQVASLGGPNDPMYKELRDWVFGVAEGWAVDVESYAKHSSPTDAGEFNEFGGDRRDNGPFSDKKYARPEMPIKLPGSVAGDNMEAIRVMADDAPLPRPEAMPTTKIVLKSTPNSPEQSPAPDSVEGFGSDRLPVPRTGGSFSSNDIKRIDDSPRSKPLLDDPFDPAGFNQGPKPRKVDSSKNSTPDGAQGKGDSQQSPDDVRSSLSQPFNIPTDNKGGVFKAAPLPFGFVKKAGKL